MSVKFYAVANGRNNGVFTSWSECEKSVKDYPNAKFKKFDNIDEANEFIKNIKVVNKLNIKTKKYDNISFDSDSDSDLESNDILSPKKIEVNKTIKKHIKKLIHSDSNKESDNESDEEMIEHINKKRDNNYFTELGDFMADIIVYTDGACINNGKINAKAGIGVYFGKDDSRNISVQVEGKQTNNTAEISALIKAYKILEEEIKNGKKVAFFTDSIYALWCLTTYGEKCEKTNWKSNIPNKELVKESYELFKYKLNPNIKLIHIKSHTGKQDQHSLGNEQADILANLAIGIDVNNNSKYIYLNIPYDKKERAKKLGCRWDSNLKKWYVKESCLKALEEFGII
jgi:ribonuclease HI